MPTPAPDSLTDIPPPARDVLAKLTAAPTEPVKLLVSGGIGTGKSAVLTGVRTALRSAGVPVLTRPPRAGDDPRDALVIDDAHLLTDAALDQLAERLSDPAMTVVVAALPLTQRPRLRALSTAIERENPVVTVGPWSPAEVAHMVTETLGAAASSEVVGSLVVATAGLPFLLRPAIAAAASAEGEGEGEGEAPATAIMQAASGALIERLRRIDEPTLDTLLITSLSRDLGPDDVAAALRLSAAEAHAAVDCARATGLLHPALRRSFMRMTHRCVAQILGTARHHDIEISLLASQLESSSLTTDLALQLAEHGLRDDRLANALAELAARSHHQAARAARLYRAAADAGSTTSSARLADALAQTGDCASASRLADDLLVSEDAAERAAAVRVAASVAMHDGCAAQAVDLFRWLGPYPDASISAAGAVVALAAGDPAAARAALSAERSGPPTSTARAARSLAEGLLLSLEMPYPAAAARLGQAVACEQVGPDVAPDSPAALVTLAALHGGDPVRARSVISRAVRAGIDGGAENSGFVMRRHRLLLGWVRMQDGQLPAASADVALATADTDPGGTALHRRDALWAAALQTAIARRGGDSGALQKHWFQAMEVLAECSVDLFSLLPLGELWIAAARLRQLDRLQHTIDEAFTLLAGLGDPVLWSVPLRWAGVHAGILASAPDAVAPHGHALTAAAAHSAFAQALATAGRIWLRVLANHVDAEEVTMATRALAQFGYTWDATRLAGQAALQTPDGRVSQSMLQLARELKQSVAADEELDLPVAADLGQAAQPSSSRLSEREREVAELLLLGIPYKDIGTQLFISAKTVEHHVARIRRRLGAESRSEMLSMLRAMLAPQT